MSLVSQMLHIPLTTSSPPSGLAEEEQRSGNGISAKDSKELVVACMQQGESFISLFPFIRL